MKKTKVVLINPNPNPYISTRGSIMGAPMAVLAIGTYLKNNGFSVKIIDGRFYYEEDIFRSIDQAIEGASIVAFL